MSIHLARFVVPSFSILFLLGCSTQESQDRLDTVLCWLRPSCLPSQSTPAKASTKPSVSRPSSRDKAKLPQQIHSQRRPSSKCVTTAKATINTLKPFVEVTYNEPTTNADGTPLTDLGFTTIYYDFGKKLVGHKTIPRSKPQGGGKVPIDIYPEKNVVKIDFYPTPKTSIQGTICVTASDTNGNESE